MRTIVLLLLIIRQSACAVVAQELLSADSIKRIIKTEVDNKRSKGIVVGVISEKGSRVFAYGKLRDGGPEADGNTLYEIGSITKVFTTLILADMVQKGEVRLDDPVSNYLPKTVKVPVRNGKQITLLHLATHTSGFPRMPDNHTSPKDPNNPYADYTFQQLYDFISNYTLTYDIGSKYAYSNIGGALLVHIFTLKTGLTYESLVKERVCQPLNMDKSVMTITPELKSIFATGHDQFAKPVKNWDFPTLGGTLNSNANDMLKFISANLGFTKTSLSSAIEITHVPRDSTRWEEAQLIGLGWHITLKFGQEIIRHSGGTNGYISSVCFDKKNKIGVVVLANTNKNIDDIALHILNNKFPVKPFQYRWYLKDTIAATINAKGIDNAIELYHSLKKENKVEIVFDEEQLNCVGYEDLLKYKKVKEAIAIFKLNTEEYPDAWNAYDSLAEAYMLNGDNDLAILNYEKSIKLNPNNTGGIKNLKELNSK